MTEQEIQQDNIKRRKEVLDNILAEFEEFAITAKIEVSKDFSTVNFRIHNRPFFFDFRINLLEDKLILHGYTHKQLTNISGYGEYPLTMANIDELLMAIQSYNDIYVPKFI